MNKISDSSLDNGEESLIFYNPPKLPVFIQRYCIERIIQEKLKQKHRGSKEEMIWIKKQYLFS